MMGICTVQAEDLVSVCDISGNVLSTACDLGGETIFNGEPSDYTKYDTKYQKVILDTRDEWAADYRADDSSIPLLIHTDQHGYLNSAHKQTFDYLAKCIRWNETSAIVGLGDACAAVYDMSELNAMTSCLSGISKQKQINLAGNHDVWANKKEGSSYFYSITGNWDALTGTYFNNSSFGIHHEYDNRGNGYVIDAERKVKYCMFATWYFGTAGGEENQPYYHYKLTSAVAEYMIDMLSAKDGYDIIVLSHIQPAHGPRGWKQPTTDGNAETTAQKMLGCISYDYSIDNLIVDRKQKNSGILLDADGNEHSYDFSQCTSDILCWLSGHEHGDYYCKIGNVPVVVFDAYRYDNVPLFMLNVHRNGKINVWKFDEALNVYSYQISVS